MHNHTPVTESICDDVCLDYISYYVQVAVKASYLSVAITGIPLKSQLMINIGHLYNIIHNHTRIFLCVSLYDL